MVKKICRLCSDPLILTQAAIDTRSTNFFQTFTLLLLIDYDTELFF